MTTASDIITRSLKALGYTGATESLSAADANDGLVAFNALMDSWSNETLYSYIVLERSFPLAVNTASYTIGPGGVVNTTRPLNIVQAYIRDTNSNDFLLTIQSRDRWNEIGNKGALITSQIPTDLFYDPQYPLGVINIFPTPLLPYTLFYDSQQNQVSSTALTTPISMPPGYERAYVLNLALELEAQGFPCLLDDKAYLRLTNNASDAKAAIKRTNIQEVIADVDDAIVSRSTVTYNIFRG